MPPVPPVEIDPRPPDSLETIAAGSRCLACANGIVVEHTRDGMICCDECGLIYSRTVFAQDMSFDERAEHDPPPRQRSSRSSGYRPPNHFAEIVAQLQGKRRSLAPRPVMEDVRRDIVRFKIISSKITATVVRTFLKRRRRSDCYKYCTELAATLSGRPAPFMTPMQEEAVLNMFPLTVKAYRESPRYTKRKKNRVGRIKPEPNNMNYNYVFYKLCQLLGYNDLLPYIPLPKSENNIDDNDENGWRFVCEYNDWDYYPTR